MTIDSVQTIAQKAYDLVAQTPDKTMIGSRLGALLKLEFPDFSPLQFRTRNLRQFVKAHVPSLLERPNAGVDILFTAVDEQPVTPGSASVFSATSSNARPPFVRLPTSLFNWRVFSNPSNPSTLIINSETLSIQAVDRGVEIAPPWMIIEKPSSEFHRNIAVEFVASLTGENKDTLSRILEEPFWYQHFSSAAKRVGAASEWVAFRLRKLVSEFEKSVIALGLPAHVVRQNPSRIAQHVEQTADRNSEKPNDTEIMFRHLVSRLVTELPIEELRALRLPLGLVFDALDKK